MSFIDYKTSQGIAVREVFGCQLPARPGDIEVLGDYPNLIQELHKDAKESGCTKYLVESQPHGHHGTVWAVWRNEQ